MTIKHSLYDDLRYYLDTIFMGSVTDLVCRIYQGTAPADVNSYTEAGSAADLLATVVGTDFSEAGFYGTSNNTSETGQGYVQFSSTSAVVVTPSASGTAVWYVLEKISTGAIMQGKVMDNTIPADTGSLLLSTGTLVSGTPLELVQLRFLMGE